MPCPNDGGDSALKRFLRRRLGVPVSPATRRRLFWGVCVWVRLGLVLLVLRPWVPLWAVGLGALLSLRVLRARLREGRHAWWDRRYHASLCAAALVGALGGDRGVAAAALAASVAGGIARASAVRFC